MYVKDKQILVFDFIFHWLWVGRVSSVNSVVFFRVPWAKIDWESWDYDMRAGLYTDFRVPWAKIDWETWDYDMRAGLYTAFRVPWAKIDLESWDYDMRAGLYTDFRVPWAKIDWESWDYDMRAGLYTAFRVAWAKIDWESWDYDMHARLYTAFTWNLYLEKNNIRGQRTKCAPSDGLPQILISPCHAGRVCSFVPQRADYCQNLHSPV
jgi:hypothetical protein